MDQCVKDLREAISNLKRLTKDSGQNDYEKCVYLHGVQSRGLWRLEGDFKSYSDFGERICGLSQTTCSKYAALIEQGFTREQFIRVGMSKLIRCMGVPLGRPRDALLAVAHTLNRAQLYEKASELRGVCKRKPKNLSVPVRAIARMEKEVARVGTRVPTLLLVGQVAASIIRLADSIGCTPERYIEMMVTGIVKRSAVDSIMPQTRRVGKTKVA